ncbi:CRISPR-associated helicase/endonuclease Cas3 [Moraxella equi]|uniref:CRISPR-associated helicase/endonuclease Cas3 n=1 Tax=Moraxella equi TaxID=60442 RepID=A0A378QNB9_9GAMM|nr:CRISPR-associated helicase/endonuclease Cas3 [Moraxella equi]OPH38635.1 CRISPR-associated helicase/endonuclease Cas3 [Moraxella equi]STZ02377.1 helicase Cas3 [Moraxella equi]
MIIAHVRKSDNQIQTLDEHLMETADIAKTLASKLDLPMAGELLGLMHDFGKYSNDFQDYIRAMTGVDADVDNDYVLPNGKKIDHSSAGAQWVYRKLREFNKSKDVNGNIEDTGIGELIGQMLGLCIASHHGAGLIDCLDTNGKVNWRERFNKSDQETHLNECEKNADEIIKQRAANLVGNELVWQIQVALEPILKPMIESFNNERSLGDIKTFHKIEEFYLGCFTTFLFSCLIDADRINSADFERESQKSLRKFNQQPNWQEAINQLETHLSNFSIQYPIDKIRQDISNICLKRAKDKQGIYTLTVPTGGGKTLASLRYALHHAQEHSLDRIIYIIPYTSIIDQNADVVRTILGDDWVLEHHSNIEPDKQTWQNKVLSENWDKPIVFTTMVQFLDSWFGGGTRGVRHLHAMTKSVLIFDEIQTLPIKCVHLFCNVINWLNQYGKSTAILCTATQPLLNNLKNPQLGQVHLADNAELMGDTTKLQQLFDELSRVEISYLPKNTHYDLEEAGNFLIEQFKQHSSCLFVVNAKKWAKDLYEYCKNQNIDKEAIFHLSTNQCASHRKVIFDTIKQRLKNKEPVICISTQLIEAGVDISMACVIRALGGIDSIAQASGRCNRNGENNDKGQVYVLNLKEPDFSKVLLDIYQGQCCGDRILREFNNQDILKPAAIRQYFNYYFYNRSTEMAYNINKEVTKLIDKKNMINWLSDNEFNTCGLKNKRRETSCPLLMQSFKSAGRAFQVIDAPTQAVIVPYGKGKELIATLCGVADNKQKYQALAEAQRYSVNVFPNVWRKLQDSRAIIETQFDSGIYYLDERYYSNEYGLGLDEIGEMSFYNF